MRIHGTRDQWERVNGDYVQYGEKVNGESAYRKEGDQNTWLMGSKQMNAWIVTDTTGKGRRNDVRYIFAHSAPCACAKRPCHCRQKPWEVTGWQVRNDGQWEESQPEMSVRCIEVDMMPASHRCKLCLKPNCTLRCGRCQSVYYCSKVRD